jgi:hypothetical protein
MFIERGQGNPRQYGEMAVLPPDHVNDLMDRIIPIHHPT